MSEAFSLLALVLASLSIADRIAWRIRERRRRRALVEELRGFTADDITGEQLLDTLRRYMQDGAR